MKIKKILFRFNQFKRHPLTQKKPFTAFWRYLKFHTLNIFLKKPRKYRFINNIHFYAQKGMAGIVGNIYTGLFEFEEMSFLLHYLNDEDVFLDIGANVGAFSLLAGGVSKATCYSIEPIPATFGFLESNIKLNNLGHIIHAFQIGLSDKSGELEFTSDKGTMNGVALSRKGNICKVPVETFDQFIKRNAINPTMIKIDVEGFELPVLIGGETYFSSTNCEAIIIEINGSGSKYGYKDIQIHDFLTARGYFPVSYDPFERKLIPLKSFNPASFNTIYIHNMEKVQDRIANAPEIKILNQSF